MDQTYNRVVKGLLTEWATWHHFRSGEAKGFPNQTAFRRLLGGGVSEPYITDEEAEKVDRAVAKVREKSPERGQVLKLYYLEWKSPSAIGRIMKDETGRPLGRHEAERLLLRAESGVEYLLDLILENE
jgi:hypothetical protein